MSKLKCLSECQICASEIGIVFLMILLSYSHCLTGPIQTTWVQKPGNVWYKGCVDITSLHNKRLDDGNQSFHLNFDAKQNDFADFMRECFKFCISNKAPYVAINIHAGCLCLGDDDVVMILPLGKCELRCSENIDHLSPSSSYSSNSSSSSFMFFHSLLYCGGVENTSTINADDGNDGELENSTHGHAIVGKEEMRVYASLYGTDVPFILAAGLESADDSVVVARRFEVVLRVNFSGNVKLQSGVDGLDRMNEIRIEFCNNTFVDVFQQPNHLSPEQLTCTIYESKVHKLDLVVSNLVSEVVLSLVVNATLPTNSDLKISPLIEDDTGSGGFGPSCLQNPSSLPFKVFAGRAVEFEARASFETSESFHWMATCEEEELRSVIYNSTLPAIGCQNSNQESCTRTVATIMFDKPGACSVYVVVGGAESHRVESRFKLTVNQQIKDLKIGVLEDETGNEDVCDDVENAHSQKGARLCNEVPAVLGDPVSFEVTLTTTFISNTVLEVSFGDGESEFYRVLPHPLLGLEEVLSLGPRRTAQLLTPVGGYNVQNGCRITAILTHSYKKRGTFQANVSASVVTNFGRLKIGPFQAGQKIRVAGRLDSVSISGIVDGTVKSGEVIQLSASGLQSSEFTGIRFSWRFLCFSFADFNLNVTSSADQSESTPDLVGLELIDANKNLTFFKLGEASINVSFYGSGLCEVEVKAENGVSSGTNVIRVLVESSIKVEEISCLSISPKNGIQNISQESESIEFEQGSKISCRIIGLKGSSLSIRWSLCKSPSSESLRSSSGLLNFSEESPDNTDWCREWQGGFRFQHIFTEPGDWTLSGELKNRVSNWSWPLGQSLKILVTALESKPASGIISSVKLLVSSIRFMSYDVNNTDSAHWLSERGHDERPSYRVLVNFQLTFDSFEDVFDVTLNFGRSDIDEYIGFEGSKLEEMEKGDHLYRNILLLEVLATNTSTDGDDNSSPGNDVDNSEKHHHWSKRNAKNILRTYRTNITKTFYFDSLLRDKIASVTISNGPVSISNSTHFDISKPIGPFELRTSFQNQSVEMCSEVLVSSLVEFDESLAFHWTCSNCSVVNQEINSNGSHWILWSFFRMDVVGSSAIALNVSDSHAWLIREVSVEVHSEAEVVWVHAEPSFLQVSSEFSLAARIKGSGSEVNASFNFGDGSVDEVSPCQPVEGSSCTSGFECVSRVSHTFDEAGTHAIRASVSSVVGGPGSFKEISLVVQEPIGGLKFVLPSPERVVKLGDSTYFYVIYAKGSTVGFNWTCDDQQFYHDAGPSINHTFVKTGRHRMVVTASNLVSNADCHVDVTVQDELKDVEIQCFRSVVKVMEPFACRSNYNPNDPNVDAFKWVVQPATGVLNKANLDKSNVENLALLSGRYQISMTVTNSFGSKTSNKIWIRAVDAVINVKLDVVSPDTMPGRPITFEAEHYKSAMTQCEWTFGDGSEPVTTRQNLVSHVFQRVGMYNVKVNVSNPISYALANIQVFVVEGRCKAPSVFFLQSSARDMIRFILSDSVVIGAEISLDCDISRLTEHTWIIRNLSNNSTVKTYKVHDDTLILPPYSLPYGNYSVTLNVSVINTVVYGLSFAPYSFRIVESPIEATMFGGFHRSTSSKGLVVMDATSSFDPDFPGSKNLSYQWNCTDYSLKPARRSCFKEGVRPPLDRPAFKFSASDLLASNAFGGEYMFTVTVSRRPSGGSSRATQILTLQDEPSLLVSILCKECRSGQVNSNDYTTFKAELRPDPQQGGGTLFMHDDDDGNDDVYDYDWNLFVVGQNDWEKAEIENKACVLENGKLELPQSIEMSARRKYKHQDRHPIPTVASRTSPVQVSSSVGVSNHMSGIPGLDQPMVPNHSPAQGKLPEFTGKKIEGNKGHTQFDHHPPKVPQNEYFDLPRMPRAERILQGEEFVGPSTNRRVLRIVPNTLIRGVQYIIELHVRNRKTKEGSWSMMTFRVNDAPLHGMCSKKLTSDPTNQLSISCFGWEELDAPIYYELIYKSPSTNRTRVLYSGLKQDFKVELPHLTDDNGNGSVSIGIKVSDRYGASTQVCHELYWSSHRSAVEKSFGRTFKSLVSQGSNDVARLQIFPLLSELEMAASDLSINAWMKSAVARSLFHEAIPLLHCMPIRTQKEVESMLEILDLILTPGLKASVNEVNMTLLMAMRMTQVLEDIVGLAAKDRFHSHRERGVDNNGPDGRSRHQSFSPTVGRVLEVLLDVSSKLVGLMGSANGEEEEEDDGGSPLSDAAELHVICNLGNGDNLGPTNAFGLQRQSILSIYSYHGIELPPGKIMRDYFLSAVETIHRLLTIQTILQSDDIYLLGALKNVHRGNVFSFYSLLHQSHRPMRMKLADDTTFIVPTLGLPMPKGTSSNSIGAGDPVKDKFEYVNNMVTNDRCYILNSLLFEQGGDYALQKLLSSSANGSQLLRSSDILSLNLYSCQGRRLNVRNPIENIRVQLPVAERSGDSGNIISASVGWNTSAMFVLKTGLINIHEVVGLANKTLTLLHIDLNFEAPKSDQFFYPGFLLVRVNEPPSLEVYDRRISIKPHDLTLSVTFDLSNYGTALTSLYLGIVNQVFKVPRGHLALYGRLRNYTVAVWSLSCVHLDESTVSWSSKGCRAVENSTYHIARCQCNHMSSFSSHMTVFETPLVSVDRCVVVEEASVDHTSIVTVSCLLVVYLAFLIVCCQLDRDDRKKMSVVHLCDNSSAHRQKYNVVIETGFRAGAGTSAKVSIVLHGKYGMSETRELTTSSMCPSNSSTMALATPNSTSPPNSLPPSSTEERRMLFQRNSRDIFYMTLPESLGPIFKVQLWHNNSGSSPSWYLSRVTVHDLCTGEVFYFVFEKWFAVEKDDGKVEREVFVSDRGLGFFKLLKAKGIQYLADHHIWLSVLFKPPHSRFTHVQRLTCCLMMMLGYMALSAFYYAVGISILKPKLFTLDSWDHDVDGPEYVADYDDILLVNLGLSGHQILVGVVISLLFFLPSQFIQLLFRRSKMSQRKSRKFYGQPAHQASVTNRTLDEEAGQTNQGYRFRQEADHVFLSWRSLQEWVFAKQYSQDVLGDQVIHPVAIQNDAYINLYDGREGSLSVRNHHLDSSPDASMNLIGPAAANDSREEEQNRVKLMNEKNRQSKEHSTSTLQTGTTITSSGDSRFAIPAFLSDEVQTGNAKGLDESSLQKKIIYEQRSNRSSVKSETSEPSRPPMKPIRFFFSSRVTVVAWIIVTSFSACFVAMMTYLMFRVSDVKSFLWLQSVFFSFLQCVFINQPLLVLAMSLYTAVRYHDDMLAFDHYRDGYEDAAEGGSETSGCSQKDSGATLEHLSTNDLRDKSELDLDVEQGLLARQRSRYLRLVRPPQEQKLIEARHQTMKESNAIHFIREMAVIILQLILIMFICYGTSSNPVSYQLNSLLRNRFIRPKTQESFMNVTTLKSWDLWYAKVFRPSLQTMIKDNFLPIGGWKLRQVRVSDVPCKLTKFQLVPVSRCLPLYRDATVLKDTFTISNINDLDLESEFELPLLEKKPGGRAPLAEGDLDAEGRFKTNGSTRSMSIPVGEPMLVKDHGGGCRYTQFRPYPLPDSHNSDFDSDSNDDKTYNDTDLLNKEQAWQYQDVSPWASADYRGWYGNYGRGGFVVDLQDVRGQNRWFPMKFLRKNGWVDLHTAALILTLTFYHPPSNLFSSVAMAAELPPIGKVFTTSKISTVAVYKYVSNWDKIVFACELLFFVITLLRIHYKVYRLVQRGRKDSVNFWSMLEVMLCLLSLSFIGCYIYRFFVVSEALENLREAYYQNTGSDVFNVADWDQILRVHMGFVLIALSLFFLKSLKRHEPFDSLFNVIGRSAIDVAILAFVMLVWFGSFISCGMMVFGSNEAHFGLVSRAIGQAMSVLLFKDFGNEGYSSGLSTWNFLWPFYHSIFMLFGFVLLLCYIRTSLLFNFRVFRSEPLLTFTARENSAFYWARLKKFLRLENHSTTDSELLEDAAGNHLFDQLLPEFTMTEMENQVDEVLFKMNALTGGSNLPEKPMVYYSDSEVNIGGAEDGSSSRNSEKNKSRCPTQALSIPQAVVSCPINSDIDINYHRQILMKLELEVLKQTRGLQPQLQQQQQLPQSQPLILHGSPLSVNTSLSLSSSSPQLSTNRKGVEKTAEYKSSARPGNRIANLCKPPLPRATTTSSTATATTTLIEMVPSVRTSIINGQVCSQALAPSKVRTGTTGSHASSAFTPLCALPPSGEGGLRRSRSVRCRKLETMAEESEENDVASKNHLAVGRRGKSADSNLVIIYESERSARTGLATENGDKVTEKSREARTDTNFDIPIDVLSKVMPRLASDAFSKELTSQQEHPFSSKRPMKSNNVTIEITEDPGQTVTTEKSHQRAKSQEPVTRKSLAEARGESKWLGRSYKNGVTSASRSNLTKTTSFEMRQEKPAEESQRSRLFGSKQPALSPRSTSGSQNSEGKNQLAETSLAEKKDHALSKCKRTKSMRVIEDLV